LRGQVAWAIPLPFVEGFGFIVEVGDSSAALLGLAEMKMGKQRGGVSAAVLEAPETGYASGYTAAQEPAWRGQEPAPAGALQRGYAGDASETSGYGHDEDEYRPRRGALRPSVRGLLRSTAGRIAVGTVLVVLVGGLVLAVAAVRYYLLHDSRFLVAESDDIQISGNTHLTRAQLLDVFGSDLERNIFRVSLSDRQADLERLPWVQHATVMRLLPNHLQVEIVERTPVAFARQGTQIGLVDASGVLLDNGGNSTTEAHYSFPVLTGIVAGDPAATRAARMVIYQRFMKELDGGGKSLSKTISEVDVSDPDDLKAMVATNGPEILVHFGDDQFLSRYNQFEKLLPEWKQQYPKLASADMRYQGQIVLEMRKDGDGAVVAAPASLAAEAAAAPKVATVAKAAALPLALAARAKTVKAAGSKSAAPKAKVVTAKAPAKRAAKPVVKKVSVKAKKVIAKPAVAHVSGSSKANDKVFAALAAQRKAQSVQ
jgi:cell division protein FtsQ